MSGSSAAVIRGKGRRVIVVGSGVSGLSAVLDLVRAGVPVLQISSGPTRQSPSARSQEGIAVALDRSDQQRSDHRSASQAQIVGRAAQPLVEHLVEQAPMLVEELTSLGVPFCRDPSGELGRVTLPGWGGLPVVSAGATTGQQVAAALERQVRGFDWNQAVAPFDPGARPQPLLERLEYWDVLGLIQDDHGVAIGVLACDQRTLALRAFAADAVCLATGGLAGLFGMSGSPGAAGAALGAALRAGAVVANLGRIGWEPTCLDGAVKRPLGSLLCSLGARLWSPRGEMRGLAPTALAADECELWPAKDRANPDALSQALRRRIAGGSPVFLDLSHLDRDTLSTRARWALELVRFFGDADPFAGPVRVVPCPSGSRGGLWVDCETDLEGRIVLDSPRNQATSVSGLYAAGGIEWLHCQVGALPGNRLTAGMLAGRLAGAGIRAYQSRIETSAFALPQSVFDRALEALESRLGRDASDRPPREGASALQIQERLADVAVRVARRDGRAEQWRAALTAVEDEMSGCDVLAAERRQSPERRAALHWDGLRTVVRTLVESAALELSSGADAGRGLREVMMRWEAGVLECVDAFEYQCGGHAVAVSSDTGMDRPDDIAGAAPIGALSMPDVPGCEGEGSTQRRGDRPEVIAKPPGQRTLVLRVLRQDALERPTTRRWESYEVPYDGGSTLADALRAIQLRPITADGRRVNPIAFEYECREGSCGACTVLTNGRATRACTAKLGEISPRGKPVSVAPLTKFPVVRDLVVDRSRLDTDLGAIAVAFDRDGLLDGAAVLQPPATQQVVYALSRCIGCAACLEACPEYGSHTDFVGAAVLAEIDCRELSPRADHGRGRRLAVATGVGGIDECGKSGNCALVCPVGVPLTDSLGRLSRVAARRWLAHWAQA